jgi:hypothetical protein
MNLFQRLCCLIGGFFGIWASQMMFFVARDTDSGSYSLAAAWVATLGILSVSLAARKPGLRVYES